MALTKATPLFTSKNELLHHALRPKARNGDAILFIRFLLQLILESCQYMSNHFTNLQLQTFIKARVLGQGLSKITIKNNM